MRLDCVCVRARARVSSLPCKYCLKQKCYEQDQRRYYHIFAFEHIVYKMKHENEGISRKSSGTVWKKSALAYTHKQSHTLYYIGYNDEDWRYFFSTSTRKSSRHSTHTHTRAVPNADYLFHGNKRRVCAIVSMEMYGGVLHISALNLEIPWNRKLIAHPARFLTEAIVISTRGNNNAKQTRTG